MSYKVGPLSNYSGEGLYLSPNVYMPSSTSGFTVMAWCHAGFTSRYAETIATNVDGSGNVIYSWVFQYAPREGDSARGGGEAVYISGYYLAVNQGNGKAWTYALKGTTVALSGVHHICFEFGGQAAVSGQVTDCYVDGNSTAVTSTMNLAWQVVTAQTSSLCILGGNYTDAWTNCGGGAGGLEGIADFRYYNRRLTTPEVMTIVKSRGRDGIINGLVYWLPFNENTSGAKIAAINLVGSNPTGQSGTYTQIKAPFEKRIVWG